MNGEPVGHEPAHVFDFEAVLTAALDKLASEDGTIQADPETAAAEVAPAIRIALMREIAKMSEGSEANQLATYCANVSYDKLTADEIREYGDEWAASMLDEAEREGPLSDVAKSRLEHSLLGYEVAASLPTERLRELFEADDYGLAWGVMDSEQTEYYEQDEGEQRGYAAVLAMLGADPNDPYAELREGSEA